MRHPAKVIVRWWAFSILGSMNSFGATIRTRKIVVAAPPRRLICGFWVKALPLCRAVPQVHALTCQMQDRVRPFRALLQGLDSFGGRQYLELDFPAMSLAVHLFHHRQRSGSGADHKTPHFQGISSSIESRVCPNLSRNLLDGFFLRLRMRPRSITTRSFLDREPG
jgi:hypothetical protein